MLNAFQFSSMPQRLQLVRLSESNNLKTRPPYPSIRCTCLLWRPQTWTLDVPTCNDARRLGEVTFLKPCELIHLLSSTPQHCRRQWCSTLTRAVSQLLLYFVFYSVYTICVSPFTLAARHAFRSRQIPSRALTSSLRTSFCTALPPSWTNSISQRRSCTKAPSSPLNSAPRSTSVRFRCPL
jgi:hypothetical protein